MHFDDALEMYVSEIDGIIFACEDENIVYHGKKIQSDINKEVVVVNKDGKVLAVYGPDGHGYLKSIRGLF